MPGQIRANFKINIFCIQRTFFGIKIFSAFQICNKFSSRTPQNCKSINDVTPFSLYSAFKRSKMDILLKFGMSIVLTYSSNIYQVFEHFGKFKFYNRFPKKKF